MRLLGVTVASVTVENDAEAEEDEAGIGGGSCHNFERDTSPITPEDRYDWEWEDRGFGFRGL